MPTPFNTSALREALLSLQHLGIVPGMAVAPSDSIAREIETRVINDVGAFSSSANPDVVPELRAHLGDLVTDVLNLLAGKRPEEPAFVRRYAQRRAQQRFPLEATLHTYRSAHRVLAEWVRDAALTAADPDAQIRRVVAAAADFMIEYTNAISTVATGEYVQETRILAEAEGDRRTELMTTLLSGYDESDGRTAALLRSAGYLAQRQSYCVIVARSANPREMDNNARAQRMLESLNDVLRETPVRTLTGVREGLVTVIVSVTRRLSGWTVAQSLLADRVYPNLQRIGPAAVIGLSNDAPSTSHVRRAHREALIALDFASVANRVMSYADIPFRRMIVRHARDRLQTALPSWLDSFQSADRKARGNLSRTLRCYADANMNALQTAKDLSLHANTIYARMQKIGDLTGKNPLTYHDLTEMLLVLESVDPQWAGSQLSRAAKAS